VSIASRLRKLEGAGHRFDPEDCPGGPTVFLHYREGETPPALPEDALACALCGVPHVLRVKYVVVQTREEADAMIGDLSRQSGVKRQ
jgi:hypothetical protein